MEMVNIGNDIRKATLMTTTIAFLAGITIGYSYCLHNPKKIE